MHSTNGGIVARIVSCVAVWHAGEIVLVAEAVWVGVAVAVAVRVNVGAAAVCD